MGFCESCGYLTMAKQTNWGHFEERIKIHLHLTRRIPGICRRTLNCPDMVVHTPHTKWSLKEREKMGAFGSYILEPYGMNGYNSYEFGGFSWPVASLSGILDSRQCKYPNGYDL